MNRHWLICLGIACAFTGCVERHSSQPASVDQCPDDPLKTRPGACGCGVPDIFDIAAGDYTCNLIEDVDLCPNDPLKTAPGVCGCGTQDNDKDKNGILDCIEEHVDLCPDDPDKKLPGICGCGIPDDDDNHDGIPNCLDPKIDLCPADDNKTLPGECGCGVKDLVYDNGSTVCSDIDLCPKDRSKTNPGVCGCGIADVDLDNNGTTDCLEDNVDYCLKSEEKRLPGVCGCDVSDLDIDELTGMPRCLSPIIDLCPNDPLKTRPGICGCGVSDEDDADGDTVPDCIDKCPNDRNKSAEGVCGCGVEDSADNLADFDEDGTPNCIDFCPDNPWKSQQDACESCSSLEVSYNDDSICAKMISDAETFITFRNDWNKGVYRNSTQEKAFMLVNDINLGDRLTQKQAEQWVGIGTESQPFDAIFLGNGHTMNAVHTNGKNTVTLILGNANASHVGIFGFTRAARIDNLHLELSFVGKDYVAPLIASAEGTHITNITLNHSTVTAESYGAGIVALFYAGTMKDVFGLEDSEIRVSNQMAGGIAGVVTDSQISHVAFMGNLTCQESAGGIAGMLETSTLSNSYTMGNMIGGSKIGGIVGELASRSSLLNVYSTTRLVCQMGPCALLTAVIRDFSTLLNGYTAGRIVNDIPENVPSDDPTEPVDPNEDPDNPSDDTVFEVPLAALIASIASSDNVIGKLYYWQKIAYPPIPIDSLSLKYIQEPEIFGFPQLVPYLLDPATLKSKNRLLDTLSDNLTCYNDNSCTLEGTACYDWISSPNITIYIPESEKPMSVHLPVFNLE